MSEPNELGIELVKELLKPSKESNEANELPKRSGIVPTKRLDETEQLRSQLKVDIVSSTVPLKLLYDRSRELRRVKRLNDEGSVEVN
jgi:hypothetical protein